MRAIITIVKTIGIFDKNLIWTSSPCRLYPYEFVLLPLCTAVPPRHSVPSLSVTRSPNSIVLAVSKRYRPTILPSKNYCGRGGEGRGAIVFKKKKKLREIIAGPEYGYIVRLLYVRFDVAWDRNPPKTAVEPIRFYYCCLFARAVRLEMKGFFFSFSASPRPRCVKKKKKETYRRRTKEYYRPRHKRLSL